LILNDVTTGPSNDLQVSTALAREMVTKYGMSDKIGAVALEGNGGNTLFGSRGVGEQEYSEKVSALIDEEVSKIMTSSMEKAKEIINTHRKALEAVTKRLIEVETIEREDYEKIIIAHGIPLKQKKDIEHQG
jgi:cell division protease FtsH